MTLKDVKSLLNISSTEYDAYYKELIEPVEDWTKNYCNDDFDKFMPSGVKLFIAKKIEAYEKEHGANSESLGDYSINYGSDDELVIRLLQPYVKVGFI
jgi:hypothetical protein